jgi:hypothetical protein
LIWEVFSMGAVVVLKRRYELFAISWILLIGLFAMSAAAQSQQQYNPPPPPPPPSSSNAPSEAPASAPEPPPNQLLSPRDLDHLVARIALYPDSLLAQVLAASTYSDQIPPAAQWADEHSYLKGDALANAIQEDNLNFDPSVMALLPFPSVLDMMASDATWTQQLGQAVLDQRPDVMDAVQRMRKKAYDYGYLRSDPYDQVINSGGYIEVLPVNPAYVYVPAYNPAIVFAAPRHGFFIGGAIHFGPAVVIGGGFYPFGWAHPYFGWDRHMFFFDNAPWNRRWDNRGYYHHPYAHPWVRRPGPRIEHHDYRDHDHGREHGNHDRDHHR